MAAPPPLAQETVWTDKSKFEDAEAQFHAQLAKPSEQPVAVPEPQQPLQVSNQNDQGTVEVQPDPNPVAQETVTEQPPPVAASVVQDPQPVPEVVIADTPAPAPAPEAEQAPPAPVVGTPVVGTYEKPGEVCPHLEKKKDGAQDQQSLPDTNVKEKKQKKAKVTNVKEQVAEEGHQAEEETVAKDSQAPQQLASSKGEKKGKEKQAGKEKEKVQSEKGGKQKKQAKDKQVNKDEAVVDNVAAASADAVAAEAQTESRKKGKKKEEKQDGGEEKKVGQKTAAKKGKHGDKVIESTPPVVEVAIKAKDEKADSSQKARTGTCNGKSSLTDEIARARHHIKSSLQSVDALPKAAKEQSPEFAGRLGKLEEENKKLNKVIDNLQGLISKLESRVSLLEAGGLKPTAVPAPTAASKPKEVKPASTEKKEEDDDDVDLFGASDEDDAEKERLHQERVKAYAEKKSKKPALIAKSSVILDVKPWDDETDMKEMERLVREIQMEGLVWGASKLVPLAFGIHKLQLCCVVEDEKVSIDELQERIQEIEQFVQSADVAAFNKV